MTLQAIDIDVSPSAATQAAANIQPTAFIAFDRGRKSRDIRSGTTVR